MFLEITVSGYKKADLLWKEFFEGMYLKLAVAF